MEQDNTIDAMQSGIAAAVGWMYQAACQLADDGKDIRQMEAPYFLERALRDLTETYEAGRKSPLVPHNTRNQRPA